jgi:hypothetical protein
MIAAPVGAASAASPAASGAPPATGDNAVILQMGSCCGFTPVTYSLLSMPTFTLYADGTVIYRPNVPDTGSVGPVIELPPLQQAQLTQAQSDELIAYALGPGGLADARAVYDEMFVSDMPTTTFSVVADGTAKTVSVYALGVENPQGSADAEELAKLEALAVRLSDFGAELAKLGVPSTVYQPTAYLGTLIPDYEGNTEPSAPWPFTDLQPSDFVVDQPDFTSVAILTPDQVAKVTPVPTGGVGGVLVTTPDGVRMSLTIRPLLPSEDQTVLPVASEAPSAQP